MLYLLPATKVMVPVSGVLAWSVQSLMTVVPLMMSRTPSSDVVVKV